MRSNVEDVAYGRLEICYAACYKIIPPGLFYSFLRSPHSHFALRAHASYWVVHYRHASGVPLFFIIVSSFIDTSPCGSAALILKKNTLTPKLPKTLINKVTSSTLLYLCCRLPHIGFANVGLFRKQPPTAVGDSIRFAVHLITALPPFSRMKHSLTQYLYLYYLDPDKKQLGRRSFRRPKGME